MGEDVLCGHPLSFTPAAQPHSQPGPISWRSKQSPEGVGGNLNMASVPLRPSSGLLPGIQAELLDEGGSLEPQCPPLRDLGGRGVPSSWSHGQHKR